MQKLLSFLISGLLCACGEVIAMSFWRMAFIAFLLRLFVVSPLGPLLALLMGNVWCVGNIGRILDFLRSAHSRFTA